MKFILETLLDKGLVKGEYDPLMHVHSIRVSNIILMIVWSSS